MAGVPVSRTRSNSGLSVFVAQEEASSASVSEDCRMKVPKTIIHVDHGERNGKLWVRKRRLTVMGGVSMEVFGARLTMYVCNFGSGRNRKERIIAYPFMTYGDKSEHVLPGFIDLYIDRESGQRELASACCRGHRKLLEDGVDKLVPKRRMKLMHEAAEKIAFALALQGDGNEKI